MNDKIEIGILSLIMWVAGGLSFSCCVAFLVSGSWIFFGWCAILLVFYYYTIEYYTTKCIEIGISNGFIRQSIKEVIYDKRAKHRR